MTEGDNLSALAWMTRLSPAGSRSLLMLEAGRELIERGPLGGAWPGMLAYTVREGLAAIFPTDESPRLPGAARRAHAALAGALNLAQNDLEAFAVEVNQAYAQLDAVVNAADETAITRATELVRAVTGRPVDVSGYDAIRRLATTYTNANNGVHTAIPWRRAVEIHDDAVRLLEQLYSPVSTRIPVVDDALSADDPAAALDDLFRRDPNPRIRELAFARMPTSLLQNMTVGWLLPEPLWWPGWTFLVRCSMEDSESTSSWIRSLAGNKSQDARMTAQLTRFLTPADAGQALITLTRRYATDPRVFDAACQYLWTSGGKGAADLDAWWQVLDQVASVAITDAVGRVEWPLEEATRNALDQPLDDDRWRCISRVSLIKLDRLLLESPHLQTNLSLQRHRTTYSRSADLLVQTALSAVTECLDRGFVDDIWSTIEGRTDAVQSLVMSELLAQRCLDAARVAGLGAKCAHIVLEGDLGPINVRLLREFILCRGEWPTEFEQFSTLISEAVPQVPELEDLAAAEAWLLQETDRLRVARWVATLGAIGFPAGWRVAYESGVLAGLDWRQSRPIVREWAEAPLLEADFDSYSVAEAAVFAARARFKPSWSGPSSFGMAQLLTEHARRHPRAWATSADGLEKLGHPRYVSAVLNGIRNRAGDGDLELTGCLQRAVSLTLQPTAPIDPGDVSEPAHMLWSSLRHEVLQMAQVVWGTSSTPLPQFLDDALLVILSEEAADSAEQTIDQGRPAIELAFATSIGRGVVCLQQYLLYVHRTAAAVADAAIEYVDRAADENSMSVWAALGFATPVLHRVAPESCIAIIGRSRQSGPMRALYLEALFEQPVASELRRLLEPDAYSLLRSHRKMCWAAVAQAHLQDVYGVEPEDLAKGVLESSEGPNDFGYWAFSQSLDYDPNGTRRLEIVRAMAAVDPQAVWRDTFGWIAASDDVTDDDLLDLAYELTQTAHGLPNFPSDVVARLLLQLPDRRVVDVLDAASQAVPLQREWEARDVADLISESIGTLVDPSLAARLDGVCLQLGKY